MPQDSALGIEVGVSAPNGTPITDTVELASQTAAEAAAKTAGNEQPPAPAQPTAGSPVEKAKVYGEKPPQEYPAPAHSSPAPKYGSGAAPWGNGEQYNDCVNKCMATYGGAPAATWAPTATAGHGGSTPTAAAGAPGATHTVIVAPAQGILRYVPFAVNASVGDTILFKWNANNHTVTKSSQLTPCNKTSDALFASGLQVKDFEFTQVVNSTDPTYFYCAAPNHCQKGMFGIINPPNAFGAPNTVAGQWNTLVQNDKDIAAMAAWTKNKTSKAPNAATWGRSIDLAQMPDWSHKMVMENVMYTRTFLAENPETMGEDGVTLSSANTTPLKFPEDISAALNNANSGVPQQPAVPVSETTQPETNVSAAQNAANAPPSNGAMSSMSPSATLGLLTVVAAFLL